MSERESQITGWFEQQSKLDSKKFPIGIGDDMAQISLEGGNILVTTDMLLDGVHFDLTKVTIAQVGYKVMAVSLSDCAAMATEPVAAVVSVAIPKGFGAEQLKQLHEGIRLAGDKFNCALIGGDITSWDKPMAISSTILSRPAVGVEPVRRCRAKAGDSICVTGSLGGSLEGKHMEFEPRVKEAIEIAKLTKINSMIDLSDGLSSDLGHICGRSGVGAIVDEQKIPVSAAAKKTANPIDSALNDGEDFELLFTLSAQDCEKLLGNWKGTTAITEIGAITAEKEQIQIKWADGEITDLQPKGYDHLLND